jgi:predicted secreted Zn-dependent protease
MGAVKKGVGGLALSMMPWRRAITTVIIVRRVWKDPKVQKVRRRIEKRVLAKRAAKH